MANELQVLKGILGGGNISYHAVFAKCLGSVPSAVMLSQALFWQENAKFKKPINIGGHDYFCKTVEEWFDATGISEETQRTARDKMKSCGILKEIRAGLPAKTHYRIDLDCLVAVISGYLETGKQATEDNRKLKRQLTRTDGGKFRRTVAVINGSNIIESSESTNESLESNIPDAEKAPVNPSPKLPPWTKTIASLFDKVNEEESTALGVEFTNFNWGAGAGRQFKALKDTRKAMIPDIRSKLKHEPTEQEIESGFDYLFRYGFRYLAGIAESRGSTFSFTPAIILNNYNNILQYAKQNHSPSSKQDRNNAKRDAAYEELFRMGLEMDMR